MAFASVLIAGLDPTSLPEVPVLQRQGHPVEELPSARTLLARLMSADARLLVLGPGLAEPGLAEPGLAETIRRIRASSSLRQVSILAVLPAEGGAASELLRAGANAVLQQPLDPARFDAWVTRLLSVPRRLDVRIAVRGEVVASPRGEDGRHFSGLTRNLSQNGMLFASPVRLTGGVDTDLNLELSLRGSMPRFRAVGRVVREAGEVNWPYLGYGVEFMFVPPESQAALAEYLAQACLPTPEPPGIHSTIKAPPWIYELRMPVATRAGWQVEILRSPQDQWRPGEAGPFYVVSGPTPERAMRAARDFVRRQG